MLVQVEGNQTLLSLIHTFTICFLRELAALQPQVWRLLNIEI
jgi:hypothetical protein